MINAHFANLIDNHSNLLTVFVAEHGIEECGFTGAK